jgi:hypothetical protein
MSVSGQSHTLWKTQPRASSGAFFAALARPLNMKIAVLTHGNVGGWYAATLMQRGHMVTISGGGAIHAPGLKPYLDCDGCLLLGNEADLLEIADYMEATGRKVWRQLADIPQEHDRSEA